MVVFMPCVLASAFLQPPTPAPPPWDSYRAIMWIEKVPEDAAQADLFFRRVRDVGCNAASCYPGMDPAPFVRNQMPFYVENVTRSLYIKGDRGWDAAFKGYESSRDPAYFIRKPCLNDPAVRAADKALVDEIVPRYRPHAPFAYDIRDEPSVTTSANPFDFCLCDICLGKFREWLRGQYGSLDALNSAWETRYETWDSVRPLITMEVKERDEQGHYSYAPWADHRAFMDQVFADTVAEYGRYIHEADPGARVGLEGAQMPHAFGGWNFPLLLPKLDWIEPYDIGSSREIVRSLAPGIPAVATIFESDPRLIARRLWYLLLHGDRGTILWWSPECMDQSKPDLPLTDKGKAFGAILAELTGPIGRTMIAAKRERPKVAIHYSQPSIRADWVIETRPDGLRSWVRRFSSYEAEHNQQARARNAMVKLVEDLGLQAEFVASESVESGELLKRGYRAFLMPRSYALSDREASEIARFAADGGTVIADGVCGLFDEHCRIRERGALDDVFGVQGHDLVYEGAGNPPATLSERAPGLPPDVRPLEGSLIVEEGPGPVVFAQAKRGQGAAVYLNLDITSYAKYRLKPGPVDAAMRAWFRAMLPPDVLPPATVVLAATGEPAPACEVNTYAGADGSRIVAVMRNPQFSMTEDLQAYGGNEGLEAPLDIEIRLPTEAGIRDLRTGADAGTSRTLRSTLSPWEPMILEVR